MNNDTLAQLLDTVERLAGRQSAIENHFARQGQLLGFDHDPDHSEPVLPRRRELIDDSEQLAQMDAELQAWVAWLVNRYRLALKIPACWHLHGALVEELTSLWYAWRAAWLTPTSGWDPTRWHHDLADMLHRTASLWAIPCTANEHKETVAGDRPLGHSAIAAAPWWPVV